MSMTCAVLGSGNIGTDLMYKLQRSEVLDLSAVVGIDPDSEGLARAAELGLEAPAEGLDWILHHAADIDVVFDATSAGAHRTSAPQLQEAGIRSIDLTPAKLGPGVVPVVNLESNLEAPDVNMVTCGGQATIPVVAAVSRAATTTYAEIVATIASRSAGPGTRQSIDEFTRTTANGLTDIGGADEGKAIIVLNPVEPPMAMRCTVFVEFAPSASHEAIVSSLEQMEQEVRAYVPGYRFRSEPLVDDGLVTVFVEVEGAGDYLPSYSGNLDIMTAAAVAVGEEVAQARAGKAEVAP